MPRDGSGVYHRPVGTDAVPDTTIESAKYNVNVADVESDLNLPRPIVAGGTNATSADAALNNLSAEKAKQVVTDFNSAVLVAGTFNASTASTNSPVGGHAFSGLVYGPDANNTVIEARDATDGVMYVRRMTAGVWGAWTTDPSKTYVDTKVAKAGDTMTGVLVLPGNPVNALEATPKQYVDTAVTAVPRNNVVINGGFRINQGGYVSGAALATGAYGHDQWKAGSGGGDYSFTQLQSSTQITIAAGKSLIQPIEDVNVVGGAYVLSWTGTAQARVGINTLTPSGSYAASPILFSGQTAGTVMSVEFNSGTLGTVKLESGTIATPFQMPDYASELALCQRYWEKIYPDIRFFLAGAGWIGLYTYRFVPKRVVPTTAQIVGGTQANLSGYSVVPNSVSSATVGATGSAATDTYALGYVYSVNARL